MPQGIKVKLRPKGFGRCENGVGAGGSIAVSRSLSGDVTYNLDILRREPWEQRLRSIVALTEQLGLRVSNLSIRRGGTRDSASLTIVRY